MAIPPQKQLPWEEVVDVMFDKSLPYSDEIVRVIYNSERDKRFVLLKSEKGFYKYCFEQLYPYYEDELPYVDLPAYWQPSSPKSYYGNEEEALTGILSEPNYKAYFSDHEQE